MIELNNVLPNWTFFQEIEITEEMLEFLTDKERAIAAYKTVRDVAVFTDKRIIIKDAQGITGKKIETYTIPYSSIYMYSTENAGTLLDFNSELELWTKAGNIKINLKKGIDINEIDKLIASVLL